MLTLFCLTASFLIACSVLLVATGPGLAAALGPDGTPILIISPDPVKSTDSTPVVNPGRDEHDAAWENQQGVALEHGKGVVQNSAEAVNWFRQAADHGDVDAMSNLGMMNKLGRGTPRNYGYAMEWWRLAAEKGDPKAENGIGGLYENGLGVKTDYAYAMKWYRRAADKGFALAQYNVGRMHQYALGVPYDYDEAMRWYRLAAENGSEEGRQAIANSKKPIFIPDSNSGHSHKHGGGSAIRPEQPFYNSSSSYSGFSGTVCNDGSLSGATTRRGACSHHGGIAN
ncbi:MAG: hypothetical protein P4L80_16730 [Xanthobacteraceae bacterium]|nr:hypothetical protein [Xanthobacteraceae bacterium]